MEFIARFRQSPGPFYDENQAADLAFYRQGAGRLWRYRFRWSPPRDQGQPVILAPFFKRWLAIPRARQHDKRRVNR
jgi:hypothetical protein